MCLTELGLHRKLSVVRPECGLRWNSEDCDINSLSCADASSCWITDYLNTAAPVLIETLSHNPPALQNRRRSAGVLIWRCIWKVSFRIWNKVGFFPHYYVFPHIFHSLCLELNSDEFGSLWWLYQKLIVEDLHQTQLKLWLKTTQSQSFLWLCCFPSFWSWVFIQLSLPMKNVLNKVKAFIYFPTATLFGWSRGHSLTSYWCSFLVIIN